MTNHRNVTARVPLAGFALLAAMLFYVSGAALLVHIELDHGHGVAAEATHAAGHDAHHNGHRDAPTDAPGIPPKKSCDLCDMLAGSTHPMAVIAPGQAVFFADATTFMLRPAEPPVERLSAPDISRRGPPSLG